MSGSESPTTEPAFNLLGLNDDCVIAVLRHVSLDDLGAIAATTSRLHTLARRVIVLNKANLNYHIHYWTNVEVALGDTQEIEISGNDRIPICQIGPNEFLRLRCPYPYSAEKRVQQNLQAFGELFNEINFEYMFPLILNHPDEWSDYRFPNQLLFEQVMTHCGGSLQRLKIREFVWTPALAAKAQSLLSHLISFESNSCWNTEMILPLLKKCEELSISGDLPTNAFLNHFAKLRKFSLSDHELCIEGNDDVTELRHLKQAMGEFLVRHRHLTHLKLDTPMSFDITAIGQLHALEDLHINGTSCVLTLDDPTAFRLKRLQRFIMNPSSSELVPLLQRLADTAAAVDTLQYLSIGNAELNHDFVAVLDRFTGLETLKLRNTRIDANCVLQNLQRLRRLTLHFRVTGPFRVSTLPSLERLKLVNIELNASHIRALSQLPSLNHLKLIEVNIDADVTAEQLELLQDSTRLRALRLTSVGRVDAWLRHLGATQTLNSLEIEYAMHVNDDFVAGLCRYRTLHRLHLRMSHMESIDGAALRQLRTITELRLDRVRDDINVLLLHLGSTDTLRVLIIQECWIDEVTVQAICRYKNLHELKIEGVPDLSNAHLMTLTGCVSLRKLTLTYRSWYGGSKFNWRGLVDLICALPKIEFLEFKYFEIHEFERCVHEELLQALRRQQRKIVIEFHEYTTVDLPKFMFEGGSCRFIEVKQKLCEEESGFDG